MGQENYKISQLPEKTSADSTDLMEVSTLVDSSYESKKISVGQIAETAIGTMTYEDLTTTAKTIVGAINELVNSGPSIEVEPLSVTENGTYTAEEGKAYSPVTVNVKSEIEHDGSTSVWWDDSYLVPITVDGNHIEINSPLAQNAISTILSYSPKQSGSGDPSPSNVRPIEGWTEANLNVAGKNLYNDSTSTDGKYINDSGTLSTSAGYLASDYISVARKGVYVTSGFIGSGTVAKHAFYDANKNFISVVNATQNPITMPDNCAFVRLSIRTTGMTNAQFEAGSQATDYVPFIAPTTTAISIGGTYYGFSIDLERGVLGVTHKVHTITGDMVTNATKDGVSWQIFLNPPLSEEDRALLEYTPIKCNRYVGQTSYNEVAYNNNSVGMNYSLFSQILVHDESLTSLADIVSSLNATPMQIYYELRTKKEIPLTPQTVALLAGNNTLWTDGDSLSVTYKGEPVNAPLLGMLGNAILTKNSTVESEPTDEESNISTEEVE